VIAPAQVELESAPCPLGCQGGDTVVLTGHDRLHDLPGEFRVVRCSTCGLMRTDPRPTLETIGFYYPTHYRPFLSSRVAPSPVARTDTAGWARRAVRRLLRPVRNELPSLPPGRMLELGCGGGSFMHAMAAAGWQVEGIEPSIDAATAARALGYQVHIGPLETAPDPREPYDLIVGWMVLEHLHEPVTALEKLRRWSASDAWLVASVPDAGAWELRAFGDAWYALQLPGHLFHYTPDTLAAVLGRAGWRLERIFWQDNPNNLLLSARYRCLERGWTRAAAALQEIADDQRLPRTRLVLGKLLGRLRKSGRITIWARRT
jgi:SAM-dependent methyltransferase